MPLTAQNYTFVRITKKRTHGSSIYFLVMAACLRMRTWICTAISFGVTRNNYLLTLILYEIWTTAFLPHLMVNTFDLRVSIQVTLYYFHFLNYYIYISIYFKSCFISKLGIHSLKKFFFKNHLFLPCNPHRGQPHCVEWRARCQERPRRPHLCSAQHSRKPYSYFYLIQLHPPSPQAALLITKSLYSPTYSLDVWNIKPIILTSSSFATMLIAREASNSKRPERNYVLT